jgi:hypothetical protein
MPLYKHDCDGCVFFKTVGSNDIYYCVPDGRRRGEYKQGSLIIRHSSEPSDNSSFPIRTFITHGESWKNESYYSAMKEIVEKLKDEDKDLLPRLSTSEQRKSIVFAEAFLGLIAVPFMYDMENLEVLMKDFQSDLDNEEEKPQIELINAVLKYIEECKKDGI